MSNYPPGMSERDLNGPPCKVCGIVGDGCDCEDDGDSRSFNEKIAEENADHEIDLGRSECL